LHYYLIIDTLLIIKHMAFLVFIKKYDIKLFNKIFKQSFVIISRIDYFSKLSEVTFRCVRSISLENCSTEIIPTQQNKHKFYFKKSFI